MLFNYYLTSGKTLRVNVDDHYGQVILGRFRPDYLLLTFGNPLFGGGMTTVDAPEFNTDCQTMVDFLNRNRLDYKNSKDCLEVLEMTVKQHISRFGHIFIGDLMIYTGEICELMSAMGYSDATLKVVFPNFVAAIVEKNKSSVKDDAPMSPFAMSSGPRKFTETQRYQRLIEMCPPLRTLPKL